MSSSLDHKCQRCGSQYHGQICPFCTITGLDVNALLAAEGLTMPQAASTATATEDPVSSQVILVDVVSNRTFPVTTPICRFGRDISNDIVLTGDKSLSRFHFQITLLNNEYFVEDSGSRNGTFLNGSPVTAPRKVLNGDIVSAGMTRYRFVLGLENLTGLEPVPADVAAAHNGDDVAMPPSDDEAAEQPPSSHVDPLTRIFEEGEALLSSSGDNVEAVDLDAFFAKKENNGADQDQFDSGFMKLERARETPVDELFHEQLRVISAANESNKTDPESGWVTASSPASAEPVTSNGDQRAHASENESAAHTAEPASTEMEAAPGAASELESPSPHGPGSALPDMSPDAASLDHTHKETATTTENPTIAVASDEPITSAAAPQEAVAEPEPIASEPEWPEWCRAYVVPEIETLRARMSVLANEIAERQAEHGTLVESVQAGESTKSHLLAGQGQRLHDAIIGIFQSLGWQAAPNGATTSETVLSSEDGTAAILRIVCTDSQPKPNELASLVSSLSTYWSDNGTEPKGILLVSFMTDNVPSDRPSVTADYAAYAAKKNLCVMTSTQLLAIYRQITFSKADVESIKSTIMDTSGQLPGFDPDADAVVVGAEATEADAKANAKDAKADAKAKAKAASED